MVLIGICSTLQTRRRWNDLASFETKLNFLLRRDLTFPKCKIPEEKTEMPQYFCSSHLTSVLELLLSSWCWHLFLIYFFDLSEVCTIKHLVSCSHLVCLWRPFSVSLILLWHKSCHSKSDQFQMLRQIYATISVGFLNFQNHCRVTCDGTWFPLNFLSWLAWSVHCQVSGWYVAGSCSCEVRLRHPGKTLST